MVRHLVHPRMTFAGPPALEVGGARELRHSVAHSCPLVVRVLLAPFALAFAALSGILFAILLPICGIATIAEGLAKGGWSFARGALSHSPSRHVGHN